MNIILFDVDGTLTPSRKKIDPIMYKYLEDCKAKGYVLGIVGGSDLVKQVEQLGQELWSVFDYVFPQNGLKAYYKGQLIHQNSIVEYLGNSAIKKLVNLSLAYLAQLDLPVKTGTFFELRSGLINISPIGRNCSQKEREEFAQYDAEHNIRQKMIQYLEDNLDVKLKYSIGGQISFDVFPEAWDKTYCLQHLPDTQSIRFLGDKTHPGGNDYEIYSSLKTISYTVTCPQDTIEIISNLPCLQ